MRILSVLLPHFPLKCELLRHPGLQGSAVVTYAVGSQKLILDYSPELQGLQRDMPLQEALSQHGEIEIIHADMPYYRSVFEEILNALELKSPLVEGSDLGDVYIGLDGSPQLSPAPFRDMALLGSARAIPLDLSDITF